VRGGECEGDGWPVMKGMHTCKSPPGGEDLCTIVSVGYTGTTPKSAMTSTRVWSWVGHLRGVGLGHVHVGVVLWYHYSLEFGPRFPWYSWSDRQGPSAGGKENSFLLAMVHTWHQALGLGNISCYFIIHHFSVCHLEPVWNYETPCEEYVAPVVQGFRTPFLVFISE